MILTEEYIQYVINALETANYYDPSIECVQLLNKIEHSTVIHSIYKFTKLCPVLDKLESISQNKDAKHIYRNVHKSLHEAEKIATQLN